MNNALLSFLNDIANTKIEWELRVSFSEKYNQVRTVFENGWGVSLVFEDDGYVSLETSYIDEDFFIYREFDDLYGVIEEVLRIKEY